MDHLLNCESLKSEITTISLVKACDVVKSGALRLATPFTYPNGSHIDLFLVRSGGLFNNYYSLTDYGYTAQYLAELGFDLWQTKKRRQLILDICEHLNVLQDSGQFLIHVEEDEIPQMGHLMARLAQACVRLADLAFTQRIQNVSSFDSEVEEFLAVKHLEYEPEPELVGKFGNPIKLDFAVKGERGSSLVQTFSTSNPTTTRAASNEIFRKWYDLRESRREQFVTIFDESAAGIRPEDLSRLGEISIVLGYPNEQDVIFDALAA